MVWPKPDHHCFTEFSKSCNLAMLEYIFGIDNGVPIDIRMARIWRDYYYKVVFSGTLFRKP